MGAGGCLHDQQLHEEPAVAAGHVVQLRLPVSSGRLPVLLPILPTGLHTWLLVRPWPLPVSLYGLPAWLQVGPLVSPTCLAAILAMLPVCLHLCLWMLRLCPTPVLLAMLPTWQLMPSPCSHMRPGAMQGLLSREDWRQLVWRGWQAQGVATLQAVGWQLCWQAAVAGSLGDTAPEGCS